jgi:hypothetical protein
MLLAAQAALYLISFPLFLDTSAECLGLRAAVNDDELFVEVAA